MTTLLQHNTPLLEQLRHNTVNPNEILPLLTRYQLIPQLLGESIIDQAIAFITCTSEEITQACEFLYQHWRIISEQQQQEWRSRYGLMQTALEDLATRPLKLEKFKAETWGDKLESYFLQHKHQLDQVIYSLIRTRDRDIVNELYFRIVEGEQTFAELARTYSEGAEAQTDGILGPFEMGTLNSDLAKRLYYSPTTIRSLVSRAIESTARS